MKKLIRKTVRNAVRRMGYDLIRYNPEHDPLGDLSATEKEILASVRPFTLTTVERIVTLMKSIAYIVDNDIPGDIAECGVWRGGSMMAAARTLLARGDTSRSLYLYDTFEGMSAPTSLDVTFNGKTAESLLGKTPKGTGMWCDVSLDIVKRNIYATNYPQDKIHFIKGKVEETIPHALPSKISLLRLDTDWYESTKHELIHLFPLLSPKGILIVDDYGVWKGAKKAVDDYFQAANKSVYLHRIDYEARALVKDSSF